MTFYNSYSADTAKKYRCEPVTLPQSYEKYDLTAEEMKQWEKDSGYSDCTQKSDGKEVFKIECKKPISYKLITTSKQALCHQFMSENNLL